jgi:hypothetical protein
MQEGLPEIKKAKSAEKSPRKTKKASGEIKMMATRNEGPIDAIAKKDESGWTESFEEKDKRDKAQQETEPAPDFTHADKAVDSTMGEIEKLQVQEKLVKAREESRAKVAENLAELRGLKEETANEVRIAQEKASVGVDL